jgi:hypothetical protein
LSGRDRGAIFKHYVSKNRIIRRRYFGGWLGDNSAALTLEQYMNYVLFSFVSGRGQMVRSVVEEALALASLGLFLATVAVWAQVLGVL